MATYVLVHGARQGGWCWRDVADLLGFDSVWAGDSLTARPGCSR